MHQRMDEVVAAEAALRALLPGLATQAGVRSLAYVTITNQGEYLLELPVDKAVPKVGHDAAPGRFTLDTCTRINACMHASSLSACSCPLGLGARLFHQKGAPVPASLGAGCPHRPGSGPRAPHGSLRGGLA